MYYLGEFLRSLGSVIVIATFAFLAVLTIIRDPIFSVLVGSFMWVIGWIMSFFFKEKTLDYFVSSPSPKFIAKKRNPNAWYLLGTGMKTVTKGDQKDKKRDQKQEIPNDWFGEGPTCSCHPDKDDSK